MQTESVKAPMERIAAIIGTKGSTKKDIEKKGSVKLSIDSENGVVEVSGKEPLKLLQSVNAVKAIARGFSPEKALKLFEEDFLLDIIELSDITRSKKEAENLRGRIIGTRGKARTKIEEDTNSFISVYGKTVSIIAKAADIAIARKAVEMLLRGAAHSNVYAAIKRSENKKFEL